jgi:hypothetical protein
MDTDLIILLSVSSGLVCTGISILTVICCTRRKPLPEQSPPQDWR